MLQMCFYFSIFLLEVNRTKREREREHHKNCWVTCTYFVEKEEIILYYFQYEFSSPRINKELTILSYIFFSSFQFSVLLAFSVGLAGGSTTSLKCNFHVTMCSLSHRFLHHGHLYGYAKFKCKYEKVKHICRNIQRAEQVFIQV